MATLELSAAAIFNVCVGGELPPVVALNVRDVRSTVMPATSEKLTLRVTEDVPLAMVTEPLRDPAVNPVGFTETVILTAAPPTLIVVLLAEAVSQEEAGLVDRVSEPEPLPVALTLIELFVIGVVEPAVPDSEMVLCEMLSVTAPNNPHAKKWQRSNAVPK